MIKFLIIIFIMNNIQFDLQEKRILQNVIKRQAKIVLAKNLFWEYCQVREPDFYKLDRKHLIKFCNTLDDFYRGILRNPKSGKPYKKLMISMPPQHGKTRTLVNFSQWVLGINPNEKLISISYNGDTAIDFSRYTRDGISEEKFNPFDIVYNDIFPNSKIKHGQAAVQKWALEGQHFTYLGAGFDGSITSKGATILIIDDPIKGAIDALNEEYLKKLWLKYTGTILSRASAIGGEPLEIINHTRWSKKDLSGQILSGDDADNWYVLKMPVYDKIKDKMLCDDFLNYSRYKFLKKTMPREIFSANYNQEPIDIVGRLYPKLKTYKDVPRDNKGRQMFFKIAAYADTADEGTDFLCSIIYGITLDQKYVYLLDVYYTSEGMEITEPETARRYNEYKVNIANIESNSGGRGFARNVIRHLKKLKNEDCMITWFHQSENKKSRILTQSSNVMNRILFPENWQDIFGDYFYIDVTTYQKDGKNIRDDAPDVLTGICEKIEDIDIYVGGGQDDTNVHKPKYREG